MSQSPYPSAARPNVLVFCVDEMRADALGGAGQVCARTPHLDGLARRGTRFARAYCNNPICMPARATLFTGLLPRDHGLRVNGQRMHPGLPTLPHLLAEAGYRTHAAGKLHLTPWVPKVEPPDPDAYPECMDYWQRGLITRFPTPYFGLQNVAFVGGHTAYVYGDYIGWLQAQGGEPALLRPECGRPSTSGAPLCYRMALPEALHYNRYIADATIRAIEDAAAPGAPPFFIWCSFPDPHMPVAPPAPYDTLYDPAAMPAPTRRAGERRDLPPFYARVMDGTLKPNGVDNTGVNDAQWREMLALTWGMITHVDAEIGRVLGALERSGLMDHTLIVLIADHGDMMGDHGLLWKGTYTFQGCTRLPLIVAAPGGGGGRVSQALAAQIDLLPTVLDYCGVPLPGAAQACAATPFQRGAERPLALYPGRSWRPLLEGDAITLHEEVVIENDDPTTGLQVRCLVTDRHRLTLYPGTPDGELFDLASDPDETHNLWYRPDAAPLRADLIRRLLDAYSRQTPFYPIPPWNS